MQDFDFIIVGSGSAGAAIAARLSENPRYTVLLIEAGGSDFTPLVRIPLLHPFLFSNPKYNWKFEMEPSPEVNNRRLYQGCGKVFGGSSSINGMIYIRGNPADYDEWARLGCKGWGWNDVLPYFLKSEDNESLSGGLHAKNGPLHVSGQQKANEVTEAALEAYEQAGFVLLDDLNGDTREGAGFYQFTVREGQRWSSARAFLSSARKRNNLTILKRAMVDKILVKNRRATGVEVAVAGRRQRVVAKKEVIVSAGTFNSPTLLQRTGIGPGAILVSLGIEIVHDLPGVGENLQDHFGTYLPYRCTLPVTSNDIANSRFRQALAGIQYILTRSGPLARSGMNIGGFAKSDPDLKQPDLQIHFGAFGVASRNPKGVVPYPFPAVSFVPVHLNADARGSVTIADQNAGGTPPIIHQNFLSTQNDIDAMIGGMRIARSIASQPALQPYLREELNPGPDTQTDEDLLADLRQRGVPNLHPVGTCAMGTGKMAVTDSRLRVHGMDGLRVADASIMPKIIAGNTNAPTIMIGEKAAAMILQDWKT